MSSPPVIALYGMHGLYNFGCEAILRGTEAIIRRWKPDAEIRYYSLNYKQDCLILQNSPVKVFERKIYPRWHHSRLIRKLSHLLGLPCKSLCEDVRWLKECDIVLSVGGDLYTEEFTLCTPPRFVWNNEVVFGHKVLRQGKKFAVWGASIGPFSPSYRHFMFSFLQKVKLITVREPLSFSYLQQNLPATQSLKLVADPAFAYSPKMVPAVTKKHGRGAVIGLNVSPRSLRVTGTAPDDATIAKLSKMVVVLSRIFKAEIVLIPHVIAVDPDDNDALFLKKLHAATVPELGDAVRFQEVTSFDEAHAALALCDVVIAARMHCAINALMAGVPTVFLGYSQKAEGMAHFFYKKDAGYLAIQNLDAESIVAVTRELLSDIETYKCFVAERAGELHRSALMAGFLIEEAWDSL